MAAERLLGPPRSVAHVGFPRQPPPGAHLLQHLLRHLERSMLLWVAPEGVFAKRLWQGPVYWRGPLALHRTLPNKLERQRTCQLLDARCFLQGKCTAVRLRAMVAGHGHGCQVGKRTWTEGHRHTRCGRQGVGLKVLGLWWASK